MRLRLGVWGLSNSMLMYVCMYLSILAITSSCLLSYLFVFSLTRKGARVTISMLFYGDETTSLMKSSYWGFDARWPVSCASSLLHMYIIDMVEKGGWGGRGIASMR